MRKFLIAATGLSVSVLASHAQMEGENLSEYELAVPAKFAFTISESAPLFEGPPEGFVPETFSMTSRNVVELFEVPADSRTFWVFDLDDGEGQGLVGGLVLADPNNGKIHEFIAFGYGVTLFDFVEGGGKGPGETLGVLSGDFSKFNFVFNMAIIWGFESQGPPAVTFGRFALEIKEVDDKTKVSFGSVTPLAGDMFEGNGIVTSGFIQAEGRVVE